MNTYGVDFHKMPKSKVKNIYESVWGEGIKIPCDIKQTTVPKEKESENSYSFVLKKGENTSALLKRIFCIDENSEEARRFDVKLGEACSGAGNEGKRILTLHSSSLCALLFFYNVSNANPLKLKLKGIHDEASEEVVFTDVLFEFKNIVTEKGGPSNIDVVLIGKKDEKKVVLFLESKFSEYYLYPCQTYHIKNDYTHVTRVINNSFYNFYSDENICKLGFRKEENNKEGCFTLKSDNGSHYIEGIKQMLSHFIGVENFIAGKIYEDSRKTELLKNYKPSDNTEYYLGEILFDKGIGQLKLSSKKECIADYKNCYSNLICVIKDSCPDTKVNVLENVLMYSKIEETFQLNPKVKAFYNL